MMIEISMDIVRQMMLLISQNLKQKRMMNLLMELLWYTLQKPKALQTEKSLHFVKILEYIIMEEVALG